MTNKQSIDDPSLGKICKSCKEYKTLDNYGNNIRKKDGLNCYCRAGVKAIREARKQSHPEYFSKYREKIRKITSVSQRIPQKK